MHFSSSLASFLDMDQATILLLPRKSSPPLVRVNSFSSFCGHNRGWLKKILNYGHSPILFIDGLG